jgi:N utilization substance protein B
MIDKLIIKMAICEMLYFPSIPTKVSINEYIEISKTYSTPKSKQFVNGLLDAIAQELQQQGRIRKTGRGLMDNK